MTRFLLAEMMYRPRPTDSRARAVFDFALSSRITALDERDRLLFVCDSPQTIDSLTAFVQPIARCPVEYRIVNSPVSMLGGDTPRELGWAHPDRWQRMAMTDRWARMLAALGAGEQEQDSGTAGWLIMPAHDAVWGRGLLPYLMRLSRKFSRKGQPAAVSPYTYWQHSPVPGTDIPADVMDLLNTAFGRDSLFWWKITTDSVQGFWGKMSLLPFGLCAPLREAVRSGQVSTATLEDDLILDTALRRLGFGVRAAWIWRPQVYRQALPVFDETGARKVIERTLHYSLNALSSRSPVGGSTLNFPLDWRGKLRTVLFPRFRVSNARAERLIREEAEAIRARVEQYGASWVDWGDYRIVVRIGDPDCEVWKPLPSLL